MSIARGSAWSLYTLHICGLIVVVALLLANYVYAHNQNLTLNPANFMFLKSSLLLFDCYEDFLFSFLVYSTLYLFELTIGLFMTCFSSTKLILDSDYTMQYCVWNECISIHWSLAVSIPLLRYTSLTFCTPKAILYPHYNFFPFYDQKNYKSSLLHRLVSIFQL